MYNSHFGFEESPFSIAPDPRYLYMSRQHGEALAHLLYGIRTGGGFVLLTGEVGTGKTTLCRCLLEQIPEEVTVAFILNPKVTALELLATISDELHIEYPADNVSTKIFVDRINNYLLEAHAGGRKTILIIDEAQNLDADVLEQIRLLTNLETNQHKLLQIIMLGQPELRDLLLRKELRQLAQRITARYHLGPLDKKDIASYINHRLNVAGYQKKIFSNSALNRIYNLTNGIPRLINILCDRALLGAYSQGDHEVSNPTIKQAAREILPRGEKVRHRRSPSFRSALISIILVATLFVLASLLLPFSFIPGKNRYQPENIPADAAGPSHIPPLAWPLEIPLSTSENYAYSALFAMWSKDFEPRAPLYPCQQAREQGLRCLSRTGSLGSLKKLNRPAVLKIIDTNGGQFDALLVTLADDRATLQFGGITRTVSTNLLESQWHGSYTLLWQAPDSYEEPILPGDSGPDVRWVAGKFAHLHNLSRQEDTEPVLAGKLLDTLKTFQVGQGLIADGIVGPETIISLNSVNGGNIPSLNQEDPV